MVKLGLLLSAVGALAACLPLDQSCFDGGMCVGGVCGADGYCHPGAQPTGASNSAATSSSSTGATSSSNAASTSATTGAASTGSPGAASSTSGAVGTSGAATGGSSTTTGGHLQNVACSPITTSPPDGGPSDAGPFIVSGTISVDVPIDAGFLYVELLDGNNRGVLETAQLVCGAGTYPFVLHGVPLATVGVDAGYQLSAWLDLIDNGFFDPVIDPSAQTSLSFAQTDAPLVGLTLNPPPVPTPPAVPGQLITATGVGNTVVAVWGPPDGGGVDSYMLCLQQNNTDAGCLVTHLTTGNVGVAVLPAPSGLGVTLSIAGINAGEVGAFVSQAVVASAMGSDTLSGSITGAPTGAVVDVIAVTPTSTGIGPLYALQTTNGQFSFSNLSMGSYGVVAFADLAGDGVLGAGDPSTLAAGGNPVACATGTECDLVLPTTHAVATASIQTAQGPTGLIYTPSFAITPAQLQPVAAEVQIPGSTAVPLIDLPPNQGGGGPSHTFSGAVDPTSSAPPGSYNFVTLYSDGTMETLPAGGSPFTSVPIVTNDTSNGQIDWTKPNGKVSASIGYNVTYFQGCPPNNGQDAGFFPFGFFDGGGVITLDLGPSESVQVTAFDTTGNAAVGETGACFDGGVSSGQNQALTGVVIYTGGYPSDKPIYVTLSLGDGGPVLAGVTVTVAAPAFTLYSVVPGDTLTAWMDPLGSGTYCSTADPFAVTTFEGSTAAIVLSDPPVTSASQPGAPFAVAGTDGFLVTLYQTDDADTYIVTMTPPTGSPTASLDPIPGGTPGSPLYALFTSASFSLDPGDYTFSYVALRYGDAGTPSPASSSVTYPPTGVLSSVSGSLSVPSTASGSLDVGVSGGFTTVPAASAGVGYNVSYQYADSDLFAFIDQNNNGIVDPTDPGVAPGEHVGPYWDGTSTGPTLAIPGGPFTCNVQTVNSADAGFSLVFNAESNFQLPMNATVDSLVGGQISLSASPYAASNYQTLIHQLVLTGQAPLSAGQQPQFSDQHAFLIDGTLCDAGISGLMFLPSAAPPQVDAGTPVTYEFVWSWTPPSPSEDPSPYYRWEFFLDNASNPSDYGTVQANAGTVNDAEFYDTGFVSGPHTWTVTILDAFGNVATVTTPYTVP